MSKPPLLLIRRPPPCDGVVPGFKYISADRYKLKCRVCKVKNRTAPIQCAVPTCVAAFHPLCAREYVATLCSAALLLRHSSMTSCAVGNLQTEVANGVCGNTDWPGTNRAGHGA